MCHLILIEIREENDRSVVSDDSRVSMGRSEANDGLYNNGTECGIFKGSGDSSTGFFCPRVVFRPACFIETSIQQPRSFLYQSA